MTFEEAKAKAEAIIGDELDRPIEEFNGWWFGEQVTILEDAEHPDKIESGSEGMLLIQEVGSPEFNNVRTAFYVLEEGSDMPTEVEVGNIEGAG